MAYSVIMAWKRPQPRLEALIVPVAPQTIAMKEVLEVWVVLKSKVKTLNLRFPIVRRLYSQRIILCLQMLIYLMVSIPKMEVCKISKNFKIKTKKGKFLLWRRTEYGILGKQLQRGQESAFITQFSCSTESSFFKERILIFFKIFFDYIIFYTG